MSKTYDFGGWATKNDLRCSDGRIIRHNAFLQCDGKTVPLVWSHAHDEPEKVLGNALLENRDNGVYCHGSFNDTSAGQVAKVLVQHGDVVGLSICANALKQVGPDVVHGDIKEVSLVLAGANPGAYIDTLIEHSDDCDEMAIISYISDKDDPSVFCHSEDSEDKTDTKKEDKNVEESKKDKTVQDVIDSMTEEQKNVLYGLVGMALDESDEDKDNDDDNKSEGGKNTMKHNVFDTETAQPDTLSHSDQKEIIALAKTNSVGSLRDAINIFAEQSKTFSHAFDFDDEAMNTLFPEYKDIRPGAPELLERDKGWVGSVMQKAHKTPFSRIRTRQMDVRGDELRSYGYKKGSQKNNFGNAKLIKRTTDPQTVYVKDKLDRDDIIDITDFDVVSYQYGIMRGNLEEELALAIMIGDGREDGDDNKIAQEHIRSIWHDDDLYTIHEDIDIAAAKAELQGTNTSANFGDNYVYAEAIITAALYSREKYKGTGTPDYYCDPHVLNVMLLARDLNGRRIYDSKADLARALNVGEIYTAEQFAGKVRTASDGSTKKLLGIFVNLADYSIGSTKGGEITKFNDFDIDFNQEKYLIETRVSGALTRVYSAIALEEPVTGEDVAG